MKKLKFRLALTLPLLLGGVFLIVPDAFYAAILGYNDIGDAFYAFTCESAEFHDHTSGCPNPIVIRPADPTRFNSLNLLIGHHFNLPPRDIISISSPPIMGGDVTIGGKSFGPGTYPIVVQPCENRLDPSNQICENATPLVVGNVLNLEMWYNQDIQSTKDAFIFATIIISALMSFVLPLPDIERNSSIKNSKNTDSPNCTCYG